MEKLTASGGLLSEVVEVKPHPISQASTLRDEEELFVGHGYRMDGGLLAWLQVLGSWILFMNTW